MIRDRDAIKSVDSLPIRANPKNRGGGGGGVTSADSTVRVNLDAKHLKIVRSAEPVCYKSSAKSGARTGDYR